MSAPTLDEAPQAIASPLQLAVPVRWSLATRIAFRFCFVYFGLYVLTTQMLGGLIVLPGVDVPPLEQLPPMRTRFPAFMPTARIYTTRLSSSTS